MPAVKTQYEDTCSTDIFSKWCKDKRFRTRINLFTSAKWVKEHKCEEGDYPIITTHLSQFTDGDILFCGVYSFQGVLQRPGHLGGWSFAFQPEDFYNLFLKRNLIEECQEFNIQTALGMLPNKALKVYVLTPAGRKWMEKNLND